MAVTVTTTGSQWEIWQGVAEDVVNAFMISGIGTGNVDYFTGPNAAGSFAAMLQP